MKDIVLDQEIKKDKQKKILNKNKPTNNQNNQKKRTKFIRRNRLPPPAQRQNFKKNNTFRRQERPLKQQRVRERTPRRTPQEIAEFNDRKLKVMGIHPDITSEDLYKLFSEHGALQVCRVDQDNFGRSQTTATVIYHSVEHARLAIQNLNKHKVMNSIITVQKWKREQKKKERQYEEQRNDNDTRNRGNRKWENSDLKNRSRVFRGRGFNRRRFNNNGR